MTVSFLKILLLFCFCLILCNPSEAQCEYKNVLVLAKKDSSEIVYIKKGERIEVVTQGSNYEGKVKCINDSAILIGDKWILINEILLLVDTNDHLKPKDALAWPLIGSGVLIGGLGFLMASNADDDNYEDTETTRSFITGLVMIGLGTGLTYGGLKLKSKKSIIDDIYYSPKTHDFTIIKIGTIKKGDKINVG